MKKDKLLDEAIKLRKEGFSVKEIASSLKIAQSTSSKWVRDVNLSSQAKGRLLQRIRLGQFNSAEAKKKKKQALRQELEAKALTEIQLQQQTSLTETIICSLLYWCEGAKDDSCIKFTNSDPELVISFMHLLRRSFEIDEKKFRPIIHIHSYHDEVTQLNYWSKVTNVPKSKFMRSWRKPNTGKRQRVDYQGCITINYYDSYIAKQLIAYAKAFLKINRPVG